MEAHPRHVIDAAVKRGVEQLHAAVLRPHDGPWRLVHAVEDRLLGGRRRGPRPQQPPLLAARHQRAVHVAQQRRRGCALAVIGWLLGRWRGRGRWLLQLCPLAEAAQFDDQTPGTAGPAPPYTAQGMVTMIALEGIRDITGC